MLEALVHPGSLFVTLTYNKESLPEGGTLVPRHLQLFLKRLRKKLSPRTIRYFGVGEYGDISQRPHYHLAIFGVTLADRIYIDESWDHGFTHAGELNFSSAAYVAGYVTKKLTARDAPGLNGRNPEFARMSLRPGVGAWAMKAVAEALQCKAGWDQITEDGDVPGALRHGSKVMPLGTYLRRKLREEMGFENVNGQKEAQLKASKRVLDLWTDYVSNPENTGLTIKEMVMEESRQKILQMETKAKIFSQSKGLI